MNINVPLAAKALSPMAITASPYQIAINQAGTMQRISRIALLLVVLLCTGWGVRDGMAQTATIQGIITDASSGQPLEGATIALRQIAGEGIHGVAADRNGFYFVSGITPGRYALQVSYVGYVAYEDTLALEAAQHLTRSVALEPDVEWLDEVVVAGARGAATLEAGRQRISGADLARVPTPAGGGDLTMYLQTLPGVVAAGDRGGQLFVRGGTPSENMVLVDGALIYQPFHIVGFFSAFPEDLVQGAEFYAGGFGPRYTGRISSVLDVKMRDGNRNQTSGSASVSPFVGEVLLEGPLKQGKTSWIASARRSLVEQTSPWLLGEKQPLRFESQYVKISHFGENDSRCSAMAMHTYDRGSLDPEEDHLVRWRNVVLGGRCVVLPVGANLLFDMNAGISHVSNAAGSREEPELSSSATLFNLDANLTRYAGRVRLDYGFSVQVNLLDYDMSELFGGPQASSEHLLNGGVYTEATIPAGDRMQVRPGVAFSLYRDTYAPSLEPRLRVSWQPWGREDRELNAAFGLYRQTVAGIGDKRDASSVFTAWMPAPVGGAQKEAVHALLGWRQSVGADFRFSAEGYYKRLQNLPVAVWSTLARFTTDLALADGYVYGGDVRLEYDRGAFYGFIGYGYSLTEYETAQDHFSAWFGQPVQRYHPPHDRRHQVNTLFSLNLGPYTAGLRWQLGTGLPFTRPIGFDEMLSFREHLPDVRHTYGTQRVILERPYQGRLPAYHRLDVSLERTVTLPVARLKLQVGAVNLYDRANLFYYDVYTHRRVDQLPIAPYFSLNLEPR